MGTSSNIAVLSCSGYRRRYPNIRYGRLVNDPLETRSNTEGQDVRAHRMRCRQRGQGRKVF